MTFSALTGAIGYRFRDIELLRQALTHRSYGLVHNERLEFLGDGILNCVVSEELYRNFPEKSEGELSRLRAGIVNQNSLYEQARRIGLGTHLLLGEGELRSGGMERPSILADALEAVLGAALLDGGYPAAHQVIVKIFGDRLKFAAAATFDKDAKTLLQETLQGRHLPLPQYSIITTQGAAHDQMFRVECVIPGLGIRTEGEGPNRRSAEQMAARHAYELTVHSDEGC